ncbi:DMT family transporter [Tabrizicola sp.]|uniref:DMT family transporter n=1 Tax=Tabrizicola sp. TaxID=2005166 RepID=UPI003D2D899B
MNMQVKRPIMGVALMLGAMAVLPGIDVIAKMLGQQGIPVLQVVWARLALGAVLTLPFAWRIAGPRGLWPARPWYHSLRAAFLVAATFCFFLSLKWLPIADALAIFFVQPLIVTVLSALVLRERVGPRRWAAVAVGFVGTLIIIRPGLTEVNPGAWYALAAGANLACYFIMTRAISGQAHAMVTTFQTSLLGGLILSAVIGWIWVWPSPEQWALFVGLAVIATFGHLMIVRAYDHAEASLLAPLAYTEMITSVALGWWFFGDFPDAYTFLGVAILIGCAIYISMRSRAAS